MAANDDAMDRRKFIRVSKDIPVRITIPDIDGHGVDAHLASVTRNVSLGGVLIEFAAIREEMWKKLHDPEVLITIEMFFPEYDERIQVKARVQWIKEANKLLAQYASIGLYIIEDLEVNPDFPNLVQKFQQIVQK